MQPLSRNQQPDLLTSLMNMSLVLRLPRGMHFCRSSSDVPRLPMLLNQLQSPHVFLIFEKTENDIWTSKSALNRSVSYTLTSKCASRHSGVHFFNMSTSKSAPHPSQPRAPVRHVNPKGGPNMRCFVHVDLVLRTGQYFTLLTSKFASRHNAVHFFDMSTAKSAPAFSSLIWTDGSTPAALASLLSDPLEPQIIRKTQWIATFLPFRTTASSFVWLCLFSDFSDLCFSISPFCRKFEQYRII